MKNLSFISSWNQVPWVLAGFESQHMSSSPIWDKLFQNRPGSGKSTSQQFLFPKILALCAPMLNRNTRQSYGGERKRKESLYYVVRQGEHSKLVPQELRLGLPWGLRQWGICLQCRRPGFDLRVGKIPLEKGMATHSCLENSMDRGAWWATVYRVAKSWTQLSTTESVINLPER